MRDDATVLDDSNKVTTPSAFGFKDREMYTPGVSEEVKRQNTMEEEREKAEEEGKASVEERKTAEQQEREAFLQKIYDDILGSVNTARDATNTSALNISSSNPNSFSSVSRGQSAEYSNADDSTKAVEYINQNLNNNVNTSYQNAVNAGIEKLKGRQETTLANYLKEAGDLQIDAQNQANTANLLSTTLASLSDALKRSK